MGFTEKKTPSVSEVVLMKWIGHTPFSSVERFRGLGSLCQLLRGKCPVSESDSSCCCSEELPAQRDKGWLKQARYFRLRLIFLSLTFVVLCKSHTSLVSIVFASLLTSKCRKQTKPRQKLQTQNVMCIWCVFVFHFSSGLKCPALQVWKHAVPY